MTQHLIITVDAELSSFPNEMGLWGRIGDEDWGIGRIIEAFDQNGIPGTFFLDVYGGNAKDITAQRRAAELIVSRGQDIQLHTHPGPAFDRTRGQLWQYTLAEQEDILELGCERLKAWCGMRPVLHRAGDWAADNNSLKALRHRGFRGDFSASAWSKNCNITSEYIKGNGWAVIEGLMCGIGTCYRDFFTQRVRRVDLDGVSFSEVKDVLAERANPMFITLHSFSLLRYNHGHQCFSPDSDYIKRLSEFCNTARDMGYKLVTCMEALDLIEKTDPKALPWTPLPTSSMRASCAGIIKSVRRRVAKLTQ